MVEKILCLICNNGLDATPDSPHGLMTRLMQRGYTLQEVELLRSTKNCMYLMQSKLAEPRDLFV